jgi:glycosyltransferase involved in cell wall biosynthesis
METSYKEQEKGPDQWSEGSIHIIGSRQYGGADRFYVRLVRALAARGHRVLAVNRPGAPVHQALKNLVPQKFVPMMNGFDLYSMWQIRRLVGTYQFPIIQTYMGRATRLTRLPKRVPAIHIARLGGFYKIDGYYRHADVWVGNTKGVCDYLVSEGFPASRVFHIGNFVDTPRRLSQDERLQYRKRWQIPQDAFVIATLGRFIPLKGFQDLLTAISLGPTPSKDRPVVWIIAGDGPMGPELREKARKLEIEAYVRFPGWQDDPAAVYSLADLFVCPSRHETLGNVILEAWSYGVPVVATKTPGPLELIQPDENGFLVDVGEPRRLASLIDRVVNSEEGVLREMGRKGMRLVQDRYSEQSVVESYESLYRILLASGSFVR